MTAILLSIAVFGCGKKGDPTLKSYERPETPSNLGIVHREDSLFITWAYPPAKEYLLSQFLVLRRTGQEFEKLAVVDKESRSYIDTKISAGSTYEYKVVSQNLRGVQSSDPAAVSASPLQAPLRPTKLSYSVSGNTVTLVWEPSARGTLFNVYRSTEKGKFGMKPINPEPLSEPIVKDAFSVNTVFHYTVRSLTGGSARGEGPASDELTIDARDLVPPMPRNLQAFPAPDKVFLSWTELDELWITGFNVYRKTDNDDFVLLGKTQTPAFLDAEAPSSKKDYRITAVGISKEGPAAEIKSIFYIPQR
ncbi:MAG: hypothetical protein HZB62_05275 [Nitrospirae bacterium]|nr:hypothetical protein [Nitrospirota bacterium]